MQKPKLGARLMLAAIGGLAAMVAGEQGRYHADHQTPKKKSSRSRVGRGQYGENLRAHFDQVGIQWTAKNDKAKKRQARIYAKHMTQPQLPPAKLAA